MAIIQDGKVEIIVTWRKVKMENPTKQFCTFLTTRPPSGYISTQQFDDITIKIFCSFEELWSRFLSRSPASLFMFRKTLTTIKISQKFLNSLHLQIVYSYPKTYRNSSHQRKICAANEPGGNNVRFQLRSLMNCGFSCECE